MKELQEIDYGDLEPVVVPVKFRGKKYYLVEADGGAGTVYNAAKLKGAEIVHDDDSGQRTIRRIEGASEVEALLVSLCLYSAGPNGELVLDDNDAPAVKYRVPINRIKSWPYDIQKSLFNQAKEISKLDEPETVAELLKQRARLDTRIARLQEKEGNGTAAGSGMQNGTASTSTSV